MAADSISFSIEGEISLDTLADSMEALKGLLRALSSQHAPGSNIKWIVEDLAGGSVRTRLRGSADGNNADDVAAVASQYAAIGRAAAQREELPCADVVVEAVDRLLSAVQADGSEAIFEADGVTSRVDLSVWQRHVATRRSRSIGSVTGVINGINGSGQPYISVYEPGRGAAVRCYVNDDQLRWALNAWGESVYVRGRLTRDKRTRRKLEIRQIMTYWVVEDGEKRRFESARGAIQWRPQDPSPAQFIRELRDAE